MPAPLPELPLSQYIASGPLSLSALFEVASGLEGPGDYAWSSAISGIRMTAVRGVELYAYEVAEGYGHYVGYRAEDPPWFMDYYPDGLAQLVLFTPDRNAVLHPTTVAYLGFRQQYFEIGQSDLGAIALHVMPGVRLNMSLAYLPGAE